MSSNTILIVDDDEMIRILLRQALSKESYTVYEAENGIKAMDLCDMHHPDVVLLDVNLPDISGFEVCQFIRGSAYGADIPVIMITGMDDTKSIEKAYEYGATDFIIKPINWYLISHHVRYIIRTNNHLKALRKSEQKLEHAQNFARLGYWELNIKKDYLSFSKQLTELLGISCSHFEYGLDYLLMLVHPSERLYVKTVINQAQVDGKKFHLDARLLLANEQLMFIQLQGKKAINRKKEVLINGIIQDVSELRKSQSRLNHIAHHDALTELPNRTLFQLQFEMSLQRALHHNQKVALLFIDLDRFKNVNDSLGHDIGDALLCQVANRIVSIIRPNDTAARLGGDEFAVILNDIEDIDNACSLAQRIISVFEQPFNLGSKVLYSEASIGISIYPEHGDTPARLLRNADTAMYQAKCSENKIEFYSDELTAVTLKKWSMENELRKALKEKSFILLYQPKVDPKSGHIIGVEALVRWKKDGELISPIEFIPTAENTGLIIPLGKRILEQAVMQLAAWQGTICEHLSIAVNVSGRQLRNDNLDGYIETLLKEHDVNPGLLELEITEDFLIQGDSKNNSLEVINSLNKLGVNMAIDDFGTGYSSMAQLKNLPISTLKIDKSFVDGIPDSKKDIAIIKSIINIAKNLELEIVAEGAETAEQVAFLKENECDFIQGYFYSKPISEKLIMEIIKNKATIEINRQLTSVTQLGKE
jgi:diguanylate cyclase (GGDEF)-like protein